jgi:hypothetical protein
MLLSYSDNQPTRAHSMDWPMRVLLAGIAVGGTLAYAASFRALPQPERIAPAGVSIGLAAGMAWPALGSVLLFVTGARPSPIGWADACLRTMTAGMAVLSAAAVLNLTARLIGSGVDALPLLAAAHVVLLACANGVMLWTFVGEARRLGLSAAAAITLWMLVLNGTFAAILLFLYWIGAMEPWPSPSP